MSAKQIAIQGIEGSFHELAASKYFHTDYQCIPCDSFKILFDTMAQKKADYAVMAIENTVAGSILPNYALLRNSNLTIIGEVYLRIQQNLLALPGQNIADLTEVHSHPMAILQCHEFFDQYPHIKLIESDDTAASAKRIHLEQSKGIGAIASLNAAKQYHLAVLAEEIETNKKNFTRFLILQDKTHLIPQQSPNKASLSFYITHSKGSLASTLSMIASHDMNLTSIQSLPILGKEWEYYIHIDLEFEQHNAYQHMITTLRSMVKDLQVLGIYQRGDKNI